MDKKEWQNKLYCQKSRGGKNPVWYCWHLDRVMGRSATSFIVNITGYSSTADRALEDWKRQYRCAFKKGKKLYSDG